jgi:hypothetical protein
MSRDQMTDVFPIRFDFLKGEEPTGEKLTGFVKTVDAAFNDITRAVGDPWDSQAHLFNGASETTDLSVEKLAQVSLSRIIGPSDYISPHGASFNETADPSTVTLSANRNSWNLGYPLVKVDTTITENSSVGSLSPLTWGTDVVVYLDTGSCFSSEKTSLEDVVSDGDFFVDYYKGVIRTYSPILSPVQLYITNMNFWSAGVPWGTHNVIPTFEESASLCSVTEETDDGTTSTYTLALPTIHSSPRASQIGQKISSYSYSVGQTQTSWVNYISGTGANYRLPQALVSSDIQIGEAIPSGYMLLWSETEGRIVPNVTFLYKDENSVTLQTASDALTEGSNYRLITSGTSLSEAVSYTMCQQRFGLHNGLDTYSAKLGYSIPLSHENMEDLYTGDIGSISSTIRDTFKFSKSNYATNPHPQYLHRSGYLEDDDSGNTSNAMRGILGFSGVLQSDGSLPYASGSGSTSGNSDKTYGIYWGGPSGNSTSGNTRLLFEGGSLNTDWVSAGSSGHAYKIGFGLQETGAIPVTGHSGEYYGALSYYPWYGTPLYLRGKYSGPAGSDSYLGAVLGFDLGQNSEMNYIKLMSAYRSGTYDQPHLPANTGQIWSSINPCMPGLTHPVSYKQVREFRFRGVSYVSDATNTIESIGGSSIRGSSLPEFGQYYTSPAVVGADFINVYSNAIFFSTMGDGTTTSLTTQISNWMDDPINPTSMSDYYSDGSFNEYMPVGLYYHPVSASVPYSNTYLFSIYEYTKGTNTQPLKFGDSTGFEYASNLGGNIRLSTREYGYNSGGIILASGDTAKTYVDNLFYTSTDDYGGKIELRADDNITANAGDIFSVTATTGISMYSVGGYVTLYGNNTSVMAVSALNLSTYATISCLAADYRYTTTGVSVSSSWYRASFDLTTAYNETISLKTANDDYTLGTGEISIYANNILHLMGYKAGNYGVEILTGMENGFTDCGKGIFQSDYIHFEANDGSNSSIITLYDDSLYTSIDGDIRIQSNDGKVYLSPGTGDNVVLNYDRLPSSDPHVLGAIYRSSNNLLISAG